MKRILSAILFVSCVPFAMHAQATSSIVDPLLHQHLQSPAVVMEQLQEWMLRRVPPLTVPASAAQWTAEERNIRSQELSILYHGWPQSWIDAAPKFEQTGVIEGDGYRIVKLRYQVVPGFDSTALLYVPSHVTGKMPAILDVNGHGDGGKAVEQKQKRCINQARQGILALSLEFIGFGDLAASGNAHNNVGLLELAGKNGAGLFYLAMQRGVDYLSTRPDVDPARIGVTGLSGGGWQTLLLASLDTRIGPAAAVAGFSSLTTSIEHPEYHDAEQNAADLRQRFDYAQLDAARAPRPTLLIYNAMDDCCFRADIVQQGVESDIRPFYALYGKPSNLQWRLNLDPGTHNYNLDSRTVAYKFFDSAFHLTVPPEEWPGTDAQLHSAEDLLVGVPADSLTILSLAQSFARQIHHAVPSNADEAWKKSERQTLRRVVRYSPVTLTHAWPLHATHSKGIQSMGYRFDFSNGLSATGVLFRSVTAPRNAPATIVIADAGMPAALIDVANDINRGQRVLVFDPVFFGDNSLGSRQLRYMQLLNSMGVRPLGLESAQLTSVIHWLANDLDHGSPTRGSEAATRNAPAVPVHMVTIGVRAEAVAFSAVALKPELFTRLDARDSIPTLMDAFTRPLTYPQAPELMCLDLYRDFDYDILAAMAAPVTIDLNAKPPLPIFWAN